MKKLFPKLKQQDYESEKLIFEKYYNRVYYAAFYIVKDPGLAQDVLQESFLKAFRNIHKVHDKEKMGAWLTTITTRTAIDHIRKIKKWNDFTAPDVYIDVEYSNADMSSVSSVESAVEKSFLKEVILEEIDKLTPDHKEVLVLYYLQELTYAEISQMLDVKVSTVKTRVFRAKQKLKESIEGKPEILEVILNV